MRDLGALAVAGGSTEQPVSGSRAAAVLAMLTIHVNQRVPVDALMTAVWGDEIPPGASSTLGSHVWRLRKVLEPDRHTGETSSVLIHDQDGYRLVGSPSTIDSLLFAEGAAEVRDLLAAGHARDAVRRADAVLTLWRGQPYSGFAGAEWAVPAVAQLEEVHDQLRERRIEGLIACGLLDTALSDLQRLIDAMPFRERLRALQMEALYRSGRGEAALQTYQEARRTLVEEIGIEPGAELSTLHQRILVRDPALDRRPAEPAPVDRTVEVHLPTALTSLVGRDLVLDRLTALIERCPVLTVTGAAGCGKTRVAVEAARRAAHLFPDGVWFVDLTAVADGDLVVDMVVSTIGFVASPGATPWQDLRRYLRARRVLVVLDNCEHVLPAVEQVIRVTLSETDAHPECAFLTTSREPIDVDGETIWTLEPLALPQGEDDCGGTSSPAVQLFLDRLAAAAPALEVDEGVLARAAEITVAVDGLPLALELAAARAQSHSLDDIATQVADDLGRLGRAGRRPRDHRATVSSTIEWSHRLLDPEDRRAHRRLSVLPGAFTAEAASAVLEAPRADVDDVLARLVHCSLLSSEAAAGRGRTRFRQLTTVRSHARHALEVAGETQACAERRDAWSASLIAARPPLGTAGEAEWYAAVDEDYPAVRATLARRLIDEPSREGGRLAYPLAYYWFYRERLVEAGRWVELGRAALAGTTGTDEFLNRAWLASILTMQRRLDRALPLVADAADQVRRAEPSRLVDVGESLVALAMAYYAAEAYPRITELDSLVRSLADRADDANLSLLADTVTCCALTVTGQLEPAVALALSVQRQADAVDHPMAGYVSTAPLIVTALLAERPADGIRWADRCLAMHLRFGSGAGGMFTETKANFLALLGDHAGAARAYATARTATRRAAMVWPRREQTHALIQATREHLGPEAFARAWQEGERLTPADLLRRG